TELPSESEFYELTRSKVLDLLNTDDIIAIDAICREFVTNLRAGNDSVSVIKLNPPYDLMVDVAEISRGRHPHTLLELFKYIAENPESSERLLKRLQKPVAPKVALVENLVY